MDVSGDGLANLDPSRIYYVGQSLGAIYGTALLAVEPRVQVGVLNVAGGLGGNNRLSPVFRAAVGASLASRTPSLLNGPGITSLDGVSVVGQRFDENLPLRDGVPLVVRLADGTERVIQSPVTNAVPGAMQIQDVIENTEWVTQSGNPVAYAPHLRKSPLDGLSATPNCRRIRTGSWPHSPSPVSANRPTEAPNGGRWGRTMKHAHRPGIAPALGLRARLVREMCSLLKLKGVRLKAVARGHRRGS